MGRTAHLCNVEENRPDRLDNPAQRGVPAAPACAAPYHLLSPGMTPIESSVYGLNGLALAWESVLAVLGALAIGLVAGALLRARPGTGRKAAVERRARQREIESLRRIADELARTPDVEGVVRALLDEIAALFRVGFVALAFVSDDLAEASGFIAR